MFFDLCLSLEKSIHSNLRKISNSKSQELQRIASLQYNKQLHKKYKIRNDVFLAQKCFL